MAHDEDDDWLRPRVLDCPGCATPLYKVDHSPMDDCWRIYCDQCPVSVEVSFYDKVVAVIRTEHPIPEQKAAFFQGIENRLGPCDCGGAFRFSAVRRCPTCAAGITDDSDTDLYPFFGSELDHHRDPTDAEQAAYDQWSAHLVRVNDIWR